MLFRKQCTLIKKLIGEGKTYKEEQEMKGCSVKMISSALKRQLKPEGRGISKMLKISQWSAPGWSYPSDYSNE